MCTEGDGVAAHLFIEPTFGCVEFALAPAGWDHHRFHRLSGTGNVIDDMAHAEGRF